MRQQHKLFTQYPIDGEVQVGNETLTTPYHIYNGSILFIGGTANAEAATELLSKEKLTPILDTNGNALAALWICDFTEANLDAHHELQVSIFASFTPQPPVPAHPLAIYRLLTLNPETMMVCHGLWNSTARVVRYNQEHLGLDARVSNSHFDLNKAAGKWHFQVADAETQQGLVTGDIALPKKQPASLMWEMSRQLGFGGLLKTMREPFIHVPVVNTISAHATKNKVAHTYTKSDRQMIFKFDETSKLAIQAPKYQPLQFQPDFVQYNEGVHFVYLRPE